MSSNEPDVMEDSIQENQVEFVQVLDSILIFKL